MMRATSLCLATALLAALAAPTLGGDKEGETRDVGLTLSIRDRKETYTLDLGGKSAKEFEEMLELGRKLGKALPKPPAVDMQVEIRNTSKEKIDFWSTGDPVQYVFELKGPNAKTINAPLAFTADFRLPKFSTLEPGVTHIIPIKALQSGFRGAATWHYWLEPGEYTLTARFKTGIRPAPPGTKEVDGAGSVTLVSKPITIKVVK